MEMVRRDGIDEIMLRALDIVGSGATFMSVDVDVLDPSAAPGTGTPEPGGMTTIDLLYAVRTGAAAVELVRADVVEVMPSSALVDRTAQIADRIGREIQTGIALRRRAT